MGLGFLGVLEFRGLGFRGLAQGLVFGFRGFRFGFRGAVGCCISSWGLGFNILRFRAVLLSDRIWAINLFRDFEECI